MKDRRWEPWQAQEALTSLTLGTPRTRRTRRTGFPLRHKDFAHASLPSQGTYKLIVSRMSPPMPRALASQSHP